MVIMSEIKKQKHERKFINMSIQKITPNQFKYLKDLIYLTNYKLNRELRNFTIIQANYLIKKLEKIYQNNYNKHCTLQNKKY